MNHKKILVPLALLLLLASLSTSFVFASSSSEDDDDDDDSQEGSSQQNEQQTQPSQTNQQSQSQVTWKTFNDREGLFTVQYPSNWLPSGVEESLKSGPIDIYFNSPTVNQNSRVNSCSGHRNQSSVQPKNLCSRR